MPHSPGTSSHSPDPPSVHPNDHSLPWTATPTWNAPSEPPGHQPARQSGGGVTRWGEAEAVAVAVAVAVGAPGGGPLILLATPIFLPVEPEPRS